MQKQKPAYKHRLGLGRLTLSAQKITSYWSRKTRMMPIESIGIETKTRIRLSPTTLFLLIVSLRPRFLRKTNIMEVVKKVIQPLGSIPPRLSKRTKIQPRT